MNRCISMLTNFAVAFALFGCGAPTPGTPTPGTPGVVIPSSCSNDNGITQCRGETCQAGNYCSNEFYVRNYCQPGCTSDANCGRGDVCARCPGEAVGICQPCGQQLSCGQGSKCKPSNFASGVCKREGLGAEGFECSENDKPVGQCTQHPSDPFYFCCGQATATCTPEPSRNFMCDNLWARAGTMPGTFGKAQRCSGTATPSGQCTQNLGDLWCCT